MQHRVKKNIAFKITDVKPVNLTNGTCLNFGGCNFDAMKGEI